MIHHDTSDIEQLRSQVAHLASDLNKLAEAAKRFQDAVSGVGRAGSIDADEIDAACDELDRTLGRIRSLETKEQQRG